MTASKLRLLIGNYTYSSWSCRPWVFMSENNLPFETVEVSLSEDSFRQDMAGYDSGYKVPVLIDGNSIDGNFQVWDSLAILEYLQESFPSIEGWPKDKWVRARARSISHEMHSGFGALRAGLPMNCNKRYIDYPISPSIQMDLERIEHLWTRCRMDYGDEGPWLFGRYSIADAMYTPVVLRLRGFGLALTAKAQDYCQTTLESRGVQSWLDQAAKETEILPVDELDHPSESLLTPHSH
jgi:glutathione S-transferase